MDRQKPVALRQFVAATIAKQCIHAILFAPVRRNQELKDLQRYEDVRDLNRVAFIVGKQARNLLEAIEEARIRVRKREDTGSAADKR